MPKKTFDDYMVETLNKAEGSHGGHVIGHTRSGKPIYDSHSHPEHKDFTSKDHFDAANVHNTLNKEAYKNGDKQKETFHGKQRDEHNLDKNPGLRNKMHEEGKKMMAGIDSQRKTHGLKKPGITGAGKDIETDRQYKSFSKTEATMDRLDKMITEYQDMFKAEGARGGHVIGHTPSGRPIYQSKSKQNNRDHSVNHHSDGTHSVDFHEGVDQYGGWHTAGHKLYDKGEDSSKDVKDWHAGKTDFDNKYTNNAKMKKITKD